MKKKRRGGPSILMYIHYLKKPKYTYTLTYINIHELKTFIESEFFDIGVKIIIVFINMNVVNYV